MTNVAPSDQMNWVGAWYAAPTRMLPAALSSRTLRLRLSNRYGDGPVTLTSVSIGQALHGQSVLPGAQMV